jgi:hypothetical protein
MKKILLIGNSPKISEFMFQVIMSFKGNCLQVDSIFKGLETLYSKKIDVMVISSNNLSNDGMSFLDFARTHFLVEKIFISLDNGVSSFQHIPDGIQVVGSDMMKNCEAFI